MGLLGRGGDRAPCRRHRDTRCGLLAPCFLVSHRTSFEPRIFLVSAEGTESCITHFVSLVSSPEDRYVRIATLLSSKALIIRLTCIVNHIVSVRPHVHAISECIFTTFYYKFGWFLVCTSHMCLCRQRCPIGLYGLCGFHQQYAWFGEIYITQVPSQ